MPIIKLYGPASGTGFRCHWLLHELNLAYEAVPIDFAGGQLKSPEFLKLNPMGQVPVIDVDGFVLPESVAINHYLATKFGPELLGKSLEEQAEGMRWSIWLMLNLNESFGALASPKWTGKALEPALVAEISEKLGKRLPVFEAHLARKEFVLASGFSVADINMRASFAYAESANFDFSLYPNIVAWLARCTERPSYVATLNQAKG